MLIIGLTGTSGSGKGYLSSFLENDDTVIIDTDKVYHDMISVPGKTVDQLVSLFGSSVLNERGGIDRKALAAIVFADREKLLMLNSVTHALILERTRELICSSGKKYAVVDAPLLFESGFDAECDLILGVTAPKEIRLERIMSRDGISRDAAQKRINNQKDDSFYHSHCDCVIINDGRDITSDIDKFKELIKRLYDEKEKKK